jgi:hypothetical protein
MQISPEIGSHNPLMPIDTLAISKRLQAAGMPAKQAEAQAEILGEIIIHNLVSKADLEHAKNETIAIIESSRRETQESIRETQESIELLRKETKTDIENLRKETKTDIENLRKDFLLELGNLRIENGHIKYDIMKWMIPLLAGQLIAAAGFMKILIN